LVAALRLEQSVRSTPHQSREDNEDATHTIRQAFKTSATAAKATDSFNYAAGWRRRCGERSQLSVVAGSGESTVERYSKTSFSPCS
jgi:hypothetical protein